MMHGSGHSPLLPSRYNDTYDGSHLDTNVTNGTNGTNGDRNGPETKATFAVRLFTLLG
jgi:hypothetical protein